MPSFPANRASQKMSVFIARRKRQSEFCISAPLEKIHATVTNWNHWVMRSRDFEKQLSRFSENFGMILVWPSVPSMSFWWPGTNRKWWALNVDKSWFSLCVYHHDSWSIMINCGIYVYIYLHKYTHLMKIYSVMLSWKSFSTMVPFL